MRDQQGNRWPTRWRLFAPLAAIFALVIVFGLPGCSDEPLNVNTSQDDVDFFDLPFDEPLDKGKSDATEWYTCFGTISAAEGGSIIVPGRNGAFKFVVAPNSIPADVVIEISVYISDDGVTAPTIVYEFGPDGLVFSEPAMLVLDADFVAGPNGESIDFFYLNRNKWVYQGTYDANQNREIWVDIHHFSKYGSGGPGSQ